MRSILDKKSVFTEQIDSRSSVVDYRNGDAQMSEPELLVSFARRMSHNNQNRGNFRGQSMAQSHLNSDSVLLPADDLSNDGALLADLTGDNNFAVDSSLPSEIDRSGSRNTSSVNDATGSGSGDVDSDHTEEMKDWI